MHLNLLVFLMTIINSIDYIAEDAVKYAEIWYNDRNPKFNSYDDESIEQVNFVSQCLFAGGQTFSGCQGKDNKGMFGNRNSLKSCLENKNWIYSETKKKNVRAGYPIFNKKDSTPFILVGLEGNNVKYYRHKPNEYKSGDENDFDFYYLNE